MRLSTWLKGLVRRRPQEPTIEDARNALADAIAEVAKGMREQRSSGISAPGLSNLGIDAVTINQADGLARFVRDPQRLWDHQLGEVHKWYKAGKLSSLTESALAVLRTRSPEDSSSPEEKFRDLRDALLKDLGEPESD